MRSGPGGGPRYHPTPTMSRTSAEPLTPTEPPATNGAVVLVGTRDSNLRGYIGRVWRSRGLIGHLAQRELKSKYKRSVLGWLWSLINPAAMILIYTVVFGTIMAIDPPIAGNGHTKSFALYLFSALVIWNFFNAVVTGSMGALIGGGALLKKVYFPPECPAIANALTSLIQTGLEALILIGVMVAVGNVSWTFLLFPPLLFFLALFALGAGLVLSIFNVYLRDINYLVGIAMNLLFYGTPIVYPFDLIKKNAPQWVENVIWANPLTHFVGASQEIFYLHDPPSAGRMIYLVVVSLVTFVGGWLIFVRTARDVSEEL
jgi:ABC-type polysaccharide/polyol phosphate export permease